MTVSSISSAKSVHLSALMVDGHAAGVVGFHTADVYRGVTKIDGHIYLEETYGFTCPLYRYPRLNRLLMMLICCRQMPTLWSWPLYQPVGIATTCLAQYPEIKINRGILKLVSREKMKNDLFKIRYATRWRDESFQEALVRWLSNHGSEKHATRLPENANA